LQRIVFRLRAFDHGLLDASVRSVLKRVYNLNNVRVVGPVPLPTRRYRYTVNRSPHVDKKSREHFDMLVHKRLIILLLAGSNQELVTELARVELPEGVDADIGS
jgi:small subunit ribosomal protein S10